MARRITVAVLALALALTGGAALVPAPAAASRPARTTISAATTTPWVDAQSGRAVFVASGLPRGTAYLQWFDPAAKAWKRQATLKRSGTRGTVSVTGLPQGVNKFRIQSGTRTSRAMYVKAYGVYTWAQFSKSHAFGDVTMAARDYYVQDVTLKVADGHGCERVDLGLEVIQKDAPGWSAEIAAQSSVQPAPVVAITSTNQLVPVAATTGALVGGPIDIVIRASASNQQPFFAWAGVQVHCLTDPGLGA